VRDFEGFKDAIQETADRMLVIMAGRYTVELKRQLLATALMSLLTKPHEEISVLQNVVFEMSKLVEPQYVHKAKDLLEEYGRRMQAQGAQDED
jgi:hypothetical protein